MFLERLSWMDMQQGRCEIKQMRLNRTELIATPPVSLPRCGDNEIQESLQNIRETYDPTSC
jgi:hypothetical protein